MTRDAQSVGESRQARSKGDTLGNPTQRFLQCLLHLRVQSPGEGSEAENSHTQLNRDYASIKEKRRFNDQCISETIHALKLGLRENSCSYFASSRDGKGTKPLRLRLRQPTPGWLLEKAREKKIHSWISHFKEKKKGAWGAKIYFSCISYVTLSGHLAAIWKQTFNAMLGFQYPVNKVDSQVTHQKLS